MTKGGGGKVMIEDDMKGATLFLCARDLNFEDEAS
jgi:hypothetical protein